MVVGDVASVAVGGADPVIVCDVTALLVPPARVPELDGVADADCLIVIEAEALAVNVDRGGDALAERLAVTEEVGVNDAVGDDARDNVCVSDVVDDTDINADSVLLPLPLTLELTVVDAVDVGEREPEGVPV